MWRSPRTPIEPEHPDAFSEALWRVQAHLPPDHELTIDRGMGDGPHLAVARFRNRVIAGRGDTPGAALRDLARLLEDDLKNRRRTWEAMPYPSAQYPPGSDDGEVDGVDLALVDGEAAKILTDFFIDGGLEEPGDAPPCPRRPRASRAVVG